MTMDAHSRRSWRDAAATRVLGSAFGWFSGALAITLLFQAVSALADLGGSCARGGPFEIAVECTDVIVVFTPGSILGGLVAVFIGSALAQGFGVSMLAFAWPALFVSLSVTFFQGFAARGEISGLLIGILFLAMGLAPLVLLWRTMPRRMLIGRVDAQGRPWWQPHPEQSTLFGRHPSMPPDANHPSAGDWMLSLGTAIVASAGGVALGVAWFTAVAEAASA
jgi:hypothetical protein